jgi:beta-glucosidase
MKGFGVRWTGQLAVPVAGDYTFGFTLAHCYPCRDAESVRVWVDDKAVSEDIKALADSRSSETKPFTVHFADNQPHALRVEYTHTARLFGAGITFDWHPNIEAEREEAVAIARRADVVVAFVGLTPELEGEEMPIKIEGFSGGDRTSISLPTVQQQMLEAVAAAGKPVVVVMLNGSAIAPTWAKEHAAAILEAWYPGEEGGTAIASTLAGDANPAGRLPVTFYASTEQLPAFDDYSMKGRTYRYFDGQPAYGFGYGLSYSRFTYSNLKLSKQSLEAGDTLTVEADVKNVGTRDGDEVAELYLVPPKDGVAPKFALEDFARVHVRAGATQHLKFVLDARQLSVVDKQGSRAVRAGQYGIALGGGQPGDSTDLSSQFTITGSKPLPK